MTAHLDLDEGLIESIALEIAERLRIFVQPEYHAPIVAALNRRFGFKIQPAEEIYADEAGFGHQRICEDCGVPFSILGRADRAYSCPSCWRTTIPDHA